MEGTEGARLHDVTPGELGTQLDALFDVVDHKPKEGPPMSWDVFTQKRQIIDRVIALVFALNPTTRGQP